jgi:hypothetical protein
MRSRSGHQRIILGDQPHPIRVKTQKVKQVTNDPDLGLGEPDAILVATFVFGAAKDQNLTGTPLDCLHDEPGGNPTDAGHPDYFEFRVPRGLRFTRPVAAKSDIGADRGMNAHSSVPPGIGRTCAVQSSRSAPLGQTATQFPHPRQISGSTEAVFISACQVTDLMAWWMQASIQRPQSRHSSRSTRQSTGAAFAATGRAPGRQTTTSRLAAGSGNRESRPAKRSWMSSPAPGTERLTWCFEQ